MGDSYASGNGTFAPDLDYTCCRGSRAYAPLVATALGNTKLTFVACSGATTADIIGGQDRALSRKTTHATISIGGNDVGFSDLIRSCVFGSDSTCQTAVDSTNAAITGQLPAKLSATYADIKARAPKATIVVVGYPRVFNPGDVSCSQANGISWSGASEAGEPWRSRPMPDCRGGTGHVGVPGRGLAAEVPPTTRSRGGVSLHTDPGRARRSGEELTSEDGAAGVVERA